MCDYNLKMYGRWLNSTAYTDLCLTADLKQFCCNNLGSFFPNSHDCQDSAMPCACISEKQHYPVIICDISNALFSLFAIVLSL